MDSSFIDNPRSLLIGTRSRAQKLAFLVPKNPPIETLRTIAKYASTVWGGILSIIVEVDKEKIDEKGWLMLKLFNPDTIYSFNQLSDGLIYELNNKVYPIKIVADYEHYLTNNINSSNVGILPLIEYCLSSLDDREDLIIPNCEEDEECYDDTLFNLGIIQHQNKAHLKQLIDKWKLAQYSPRKYIDLISFLGKYPYSGKWINVVVSSPLHYGMNENYVRRFSSRRKLNFEIYVYSSSKGIIDFWNSRSIHFFDYISGYNSILINVNSFKDDINSYTDYLTKLITNDRVSKFPQGNGKVSFYFQKDTPKPIRDYFNTLKKNSDLINVVEGIPGPNLKSHSNAVRLGKMPSTPVSFYHGEAILDNKIPEFLLENSAIGEWVLDIEISDKDGKGIYKLPNYLGLSNLFLRETKRDNKNIYKNSKCRFDRDGKLSCLITEETEKVVLSLPRTDHIFRQIIRNEKELNAWGQYRISRRASDGGGFISNKLSDKGELSRGIENVFGDIGLAARFLSSKAWRDCFIEMAKGVSGSLRNQSVNRVKKLIKDHIPKDDLDQKADLIVDSVIKKLDLPARRSVTRSLQSFPEATLSSIEPNEYIQRHIDFKDGTEFVKSFLNTAEQMSDFHFSKKRGAVRFSLIEKGVLQMGFDIKCDNCGSRYWYSINEIASIYVCRGCQVEQQLPVNLHWRYRLNDLVARGVADQGTIPPILAIAELMSKSKDSFFYLHEQNLWDQTPIGKSPDMEVDLLCVSDGNVIVGECKTRSKEFSQNDINKMKEIAEKIDAKEIVFCSLDYEIDERAYKRIVKLQNSLSDKIDVQIMWLSTLFLQAKGAKSVHLPSCNHFSRINRDKAHKYYNYYEFMHETNGLCKSCYSSSKKMSEEWKYWPY